MLPDSIKQQHDIINKSLSIWQGMVIWNSIIVWVNALLGRLGRSGLKKANVLFDFDRVNVHSSPPFEEGVKLMLASFSRGYLQMRGWRNW